MLMKKISSRANALAIGWVALIALGVLVAFAVANAQTVTTSISEQMGPGDSGDQVSALQTFLAADATVYPEGLVTGYYGDLTTAAVQRYQCKYAIVCQGDVANTGYGRVGPATLAKIETQGGGGTVVNTGGGADVYAPVLSRPTVATTSTSAVIHWTTNEPARSSVMYATVPPSLTFNSYSTMPRMTDLTFDTSSDVTLAGLSPNTTYYYVLVSVDASGNLQYGIDHSFRTLQ